MWCFFPKGVKRRHDSVGRYVYSLFSQNRARLWYEHKPESVVKNKNFKILWDFTIQCNHMIEARRRDIGVVDEGKNETIIIDVAIPGDRRDVIKNEKR